MGENTVQQQNCIERCLPENWADHVYSKEAGVTVEPVWYPESEEEFEGETEPRCTRDAACEDVCKAGCEAAHPTTLVGAGTEAVGSIAGDAKNVLEALGVPVDAIGTVVSYALPVAALVAGLVVFLKIRHGLTRKEGGVIQLKVS